MKVKELLIIVLLFFITTTYADQPFWLKKFLSPSTEVIDTDSLLESFVPITISNPLDSIVLKSKNLEPVVIVEDTIEHSTPTPITPIAKIETTAQKTTKTHQIPKDIPLIPVDSLILMNNPFFIDLVYMGLPLEFNWKTQPDFGTFYYGTPVKKINDGYKKLPELLTADQIISDLRQLTRNEITRNATDLYCTTFDQLPDPDINKNHLIVGKSIKSVRFVDEDISSKYDRNLVVKKAYIGPWSYKANALGQFSQNYISPNWYKGGNSNIAILGILSGQLNYDNKKSIQWENSGEWKLGFNSIDGDTIRALSTNDDVFKISSKLGVKASGNWFYSGAVDFSTQFFNSYKGINSMDMKASFLTPVRVNIGVGLDYKYKKVFSILLSPVSYKYIYVNDTIKLEQNLFGIKNGHKHLSQIGSSFKAVLSYPLTKEIQLDSKLSFYTNYDKVEIDWEMVCNMTINRFMSTRISINPRYDNTIIGEKAGIQFKQLLSVGFSHKFY